MNWLSHNWYWVLGLIALVIFIWSKSRKTSKLSPEQASALVDVLVQAFDSILANMLGNHYSALDRRKIAVGMVAIMASKNITLEKMKNNPDLVITVAAASAAVLTQCGEIAPL